MFEGAFSFQGRIGRLNYFFAGLLVAPVAAAALAVGILVVAAQPTVGNMLIFGGLVVVMIVAVLWYSLSLQVRRIRDIGWSPSIVLFGYMAFQILDKLTAPRLPSLAVGPHGGGTVLGLLLTLALTLVLYFWPGEGSRIDRTPDEPDVHPLTPSRLDLLALETTPRFAPAMPAAAALGPSRVARKTFGKRGLK